MAPPQRGLFTIEDQEPGPNGTYLSHNPLI